MKGREVNIHSQHSFIKNKTHLTSPATLYGRMGWFNQQTKEEISLSSAWTSCKGFGAIPYNILDTKLERERFYGQTVRWIRDCLNPLAMAAVSVCKCLDVQEQTNWKRTWGSWWTSCQCVPMCGRTESQPHPVLHKKVI